MKAMRRHFCQFYQIVAKAASSQCICMVLQNIKESELAEKLVYSSIFAYHVDISFRRYFVFLPLLFRAVVLLPEKSANQWLTRMKQRRNSIELERRIHLYSKCSVLLMEVKLDYSNSFTSRRMTGICVSPHQRHHNCL